MSRKDIIIESLKIRLANANEELINKPKSVFEAEERISIIKSTLNKVKTELYNLRQKYKKSKITNEQLRARIKNKKGKSTATAALQKEVYKLREQLGELRGKAKYKDNLIHRLKTKIIKLENGKDGYQKVLNKRSRDKAISKVTVEETGSLAINLAQKACVELHD